MKSWQERINDARLNGFTDNDRERVNRVQTCALGERVAMLGIIGPYDVPVLEIPEIVESETFCADHAKVLSAFVDEDRASTLGMDLYRAVGKDAVDCAQEVYEAIQALEMVKA